MRLRLLIFAKTWQERWLTLAAFAFFFQWAWPGQTWPSGLPFRLLQLALFMPQESSAPASVRADIIASRSVSKGFRSW